jgi:hypothetical protein
MSHNELHCFLGLQGLNFNHNIIMSKDFHKCFSYYGKSNQRNQMSKIFLFFSYDVKI